MRCLMLAIAAALLLTLDHLLYSGVRLLVGVGDRVEVLALTVLAVILLRAFLAIAGRVWS